MSVDNPRLAKSIQRVSQELGLSQEAITRRLEEGDAEFNEQQKFLDSNVVDKSIVNLTRQIEAQIPELHDADQIQKLAETMLLFDIELRQAI